MPFTFLIVDDEQLSRNYIRNMLHRYDDSAAIFDAGSAADALQILKKEPVDILFLDIKMPEQDGFDLLRSLPNRNFELVFITAHNEHAIKAIKEGAADYLLKPIKKTDFIHTVETVLKKRRKTQERDGLLEVYVRNIKEQNERIDHLNTEIEQLHAKEIITGEKKMMLDQLQKNVILTEDDWIKFKEIFESVHSNFFISLKEKHTGLTQAETRLMALTKLNMSTKEMAGMLGISPETIRQTRWRLRKKLDMADDMSLEQVVAAI